MIKPSFPVWQPAHAPAGTKFYIPFHEGTGTVAADLSGNGNHGNITGGTWTSGSLGAAWKGATGVLVQVNNYWSGASPLPMNNGVYPCWIGGLVDVTGHTNAGYVVSQSNYGTNWPNNIIGVGYSSTTRTAFANLSGSGGTMIELASGDLLSVIDQPLSVFLVSYAANNHHLIVNGVSVASSSITPAATNTSDKRVSIGAIYRFSGVYEPFTGLIYYAGCGTGANPDFSAFHSDLSSGTFSAVRPIATNYTVTGITSGPINNAVTLTVALNGYFTGTINISASNGTLSTTALTFSNENSKTFTYTPTTNGVHTLSFDSTLIDPLDFIFSAIKIQHLAVTSKANNTGVTTDPIDTTNVDFIIISTASFSGGGSVSDSKGNTYTALTQYSGASSYCRLYYCHNPIVGTGHTFTLSGTSYSVLIARTFKNVNPIGPQFAIGTAGTQPGSVTPTEDGSLIVTNWAADPSGNPTINSGFTTTGYASNGATNVASAMAYLIQGQATAINPTWSGAGATGIAVFHPIPEQSSSLIFMRSFNNYCLAGGLG